MTVEPLAGLPESFKGECAEMILNFALMKVSNSKVFARCKKSTQLGGSGANIIFSLKGNKY